MSQVSCPTCGAKTDSVISNCAYCGVELSKIQEISSEEYIAAIGHALLTAKNNADEFDKEEAMLDVLKSIPIPGDIKRLTAFFMFCNSNIRGGLDGFDDDQLVWRSKAKAAYDGLRLASLNNPQLSSFLDDFKSTYSAEAMKKNDQKNNLIIFLMTGGMMFFLLIIFIIL